MFAANIYRYWIFESAFQLTRFRTLSLWWINNLYAVLSFWFVSSQNCAGCWRSEQCVVRQSYPPTHGVLLFVTVQLPIYTYADNVALPAFVRRCGNSRSISPGRRAYSPQQQTCSSEFAAVIQCWDRRTDRQMDGHRTVSQTLVRIPCEAVPINRR